MTLVIVAATAIEVDASKPLLLPGARCRGSASGAGTPGEDWTCAASAE
jgi:hypothetical protein